MIIVNADNLVLGRMAAIVAKQALLGEDIKIVNCEKAIITTNNKRNLLADYMSRLELGQPQQGPFIQRRPDLFVRRTIRGMLPRKKSHGREAYAKIKCYVGVPAEFSGKEATLEKAANTKGKKDFVTVGDLCVQIGDKKR